MKFLPLLILVVISSCSYKISRNYVINNPQINTKDCNIKILRKADLFGFTKKYIGSIKLDDKFNSTINCSEIEARSLLWDEACNVGANIVNIVNDAYPDFGSPCYRCVADLYNIPLSPELMNVIDSSKRDIIIFKINDSLKWNDFLIKLSENDSIPYKFGCNLQVKSGGVSFWTGGIQDFSVICFFYRDISGLKKSFENDKNLKHIKGLVDLAKIYAKQLESELNSKYINGNNSSKVQSIINEYLSKMYKEQALYKRETNYGANENSQIEWENKIKELLNQK